MNMKMMITMATVLFGLSAHAADAIKISCGGRIIDRVTANGFDRFEMKEESPGLLVFEKTTSSIVYHAEAKYDPSDASDEVRIQVSIDNKAAVTVKRLNNGDLLNVMLLNDLNSLTQSGRTDPRFIDVDCVRVH